MKRRSMARIAASGAVLAACSAMGLPQAEAQSHAAAARLAPANASSASMAGYVLAHPPASASAGDKFKVPTLTCPPTGTYGIALGAFISTSSGPTYAEVTAECSSGTAVYAGILADNGRTGTVSFTPAAGDLMKVSVDESTTSTSAALSDLTKRVGEGSVSTAGAMNHNILDGMHALVGRSHTQLPVPPFGTERFAAGRIDGGTVSASGAVAENMRTSTRVLQIHTGILNSTGTAWSELFRHS
jgi:hypothetical protein